MTSPIINGEKKCNEGILPADPFTNVQLHFGMLLGVDDLETLAANPRGKTRLHQAWMHRRGIIWGLGVELEAERNELRVKRGLAIDDMGRELHVDVEQCVNLHRWYEKHKDDPDFTPAVNGDRVTFGAHVVLRFRACLMRAVPAIADSCDNQDLDTAYSRAYELAEVLLIPNAWAEKPLPYRRLRLLFGIAAPRMEGGVENADDRAIVDRRDAIRAGSPDAQAMLLLEAFREYAALDARDLEPASLAGGKTGLFPEGEDTVVFLANVSNLTLEDSNGERRIVEPHPTIEIEARPSHVATNTIQELLCGTGSGFALEADGPRVDPATVSLAGALITFSTTSALAEASVKPPAFTVTTLESDGWKDITVEDATVDPAGTAVTVSLADTPVPGQLLRVIARGTGPTPLIAKDAPHTPLAGAVGGPPGGAAEGRDFVSMWTP